MTLNEGAVNPPSTNLHKETPAAPDKLGLMPGCRSFHVFVLCSNMVPNKFCCYLTRFGAGVWFEVSLGLSMFGTGRWARLRPCKVAGMVRKCRNRRLSMLEILEGIIEMAATEHPCSATFVLVSRISV